MQKRVLLAAFTAAALLTGCTHPNPIVGTWTGSMTSPRGVLIDNTWTFTPDGKNTTTIRSRNGVYHGQPITMTGTYTTDGSTLKQTILEESEPGRTRTNSSPVTSSFTYTLSGNTLTLNTPEIPTPLVLIRQSAP
jgi:hypothetical protein